MTAPAMPRQDLRTAYLAHRRLALQLRTEARGFQAVANSTGDFLTPQSDRLEKTRAEILRRGYQQLADDLTDLANEASAYSDGYQQELGA